MVIRVDFRRIGNHWYPCLKHDNPSDLCLEIKIEKLLSKIDFGNLGTVSLYIKQAHSIIGSKGIVQFSKNGVYTYNNATEDYLIDMYIDDYHYEISSGLCRLFEQSFGLCLYDNYYQIEVW